MLIIGPTPTISVQIALIQLKNSNKYKKLVLGQITVLPHTAALRLSLVLERAQVGEGLDGGALPRLQLAGYHSHTLVNDVSVDAVVQVLGSRRVEESDVQGTVLVNVVNVCDELAVEGLVADEADGVLEVILGGGELQERENCINGLWAEGLARELGLG